MMKARVVRNLNVRTGVPGLHPYNLLRERYYRPGDIIDITTTVIGEAYKGNNVWYQLEDGCYVWSGGVEKVSQKTLLGATKQITFSAEKLLWPITDYGIHELWQFGAGEGVTVAVLDTGINREHPELKESILGGFNFFDESTDYSDWDGHGTHCAGIIAAKGIYDVIGVAPKCKLLVGKICRFRADGIDENVLVKALEWVKGKADIISISGGKPEDVPAIRKIVSEINALDIPIVAAIGNAADSVRQTGDYPAIYETVISVGAIDSNKYLLATTIKDPRLTIAAPGRDIKSTDIVENQYKVRSGTSMATPFVTGVIAILKSGSTNKLSPGLIKQRIIATADSHSVDNFSYSIINPKKLIV